MFLLENLSWQGNPLPNSSHASCLKKGQAWKRSSYLTETKFLMLTFSSHFFNFLPFTLIQLSKFVMQMQYKPLHQRSSWAKAPARTKLHSWYWVVYRKALQSDSGSARWAVTDLISLAEAVTALSPRASAPVELLEEDLSPRPYSGGKNSWGGKDGSFWNAWLWSWTHVELHLSFLWSCSPSRS